MVDMKNVQGIIAHGDTFIDNELVEGAIALAIVTTAVVGGIALYKSIEDSEALKGATEFVKAWRGTGDSSKQI